MVPAVITCNLPWTERLNSKSWTWRKVLLWPQSFETTPTKLKEHKGTYSPKSNSNLKTDPPKIQEMPEMETIIFKFHLCRFWRLAAMKAAFATWFGITALCEGGHRLPRECRESGFFTCLKNGGKHSTGLSKGLTYPFSPGIYLFGWWNRVIDHWGWNTCFSRLSKDFAKDVWSRSVTDGGMAAKMTKARINIAHKLRSMLSWWLMLVVYCPRNPLWKDLSLWNLPGIPPNNLWLITVETLKRGRNVCPMPSHKFILIIYSFP